MERADLLKINGQIFSDLIAKLDADVTSDHPQSSACHGNRNQKQGKQKLGAQTKLKHAVYGTNL